MTTRARAIVPVKRFAQAKTRLATLFTCDERAALARAMLEDVLAALTASDAICDIILVTSDPAAQPLACVFGARIMDDAAANNLNEAVTLALGNLDSHHDAALIVPGDLPLLTSDNVSEAVDFTHRHGVVLSPARRDGGTNLMGLFPTNAIAPSFGAGSFVRHVEQARCTNTAPFVLDRATTGLDIDTAADVAALLEHGGESRTVTILRKLNGPARLFAQAGSPTSRNTPARATVSP